MRRWLLLLVPWALAALPVHAANPTIRLVEFDHAITPATAVHILQAIEDAEDEGDSMVLIELDTPGGLTLQMEKIVQRILAAEVPIVVWVGPPGARAASAGFFILVAADVAAMAPATRAGAASTVWAIGQSDTEDVMLKKMNEDAAALLRSIAERRGRDVEACEAAVLEAKSYEESVALELGLADMLADDREDLLAQLHGREVLRFDGSSLVLETEGATFVVSELTIAQKIMVFVGRPAVAFILLIIGVGGLYIEFTQPGVVLPGVLGALGLILFALAAQVLPVSAVGLLLIALGVVMFILEIKVISHGMLSLGGLGCLLVGSLMLIDGPIPELRVPPAVVVPTVLVLAVTLLIAVRLVVRAQRAGVATGTEGLMDAEGRVTQELAPRGKVFVQGEIWDAHTSGAVLGTGERVRVVSVKDLVLEVVAAGDAGGGKR